MQATAIIRQRGQLTIPDFIRQVTSWITPGSVVSVSRNKTDEIVIKPHTVSSTDVDARWRKTWEMIELARSFKGKTGNLSKFIAEDRLRH